MAVPFSNTKLRPPRGFRNILSGLSREVLRSQPRDIYAFGTLYLEQLLKIRGESGFDLSAVGSEFEDIFYNKIFKRAGERMIIEAKAALKIQTAYRRYRAVIYVKALRKNLAAIKIQAGFHGFMVRKRMKQMRDDEISSRDMMRHIIDLADAEDMDRENEFPAISDYQDIIDNPKEPNVRSEDSFIKVGSPERDTALERIQAGFKGLAYRQSTNAEVGSPERDTALERIQAGFKGMAYRQSMNAGEGGDTSSHQHSETADNDGQDTPCETEDHDDIDEDVPHDHSSS